MSCEICKDEKCYTCCNIKEIDEEEYIVLSCELCIDHEQYIKDEDIEYCYGCGRKIESEA